MGTAVLSKQKGSIRKEGKSWVIDLPDDFARENNLKSGTQLLVTFKSSGQVNAEVLPPLSKKMTTLAQRILEKRIGAYEELKRLKNRLSDG